MLASKPPHGPWLLVTTCYIDRNLQSKSKVFKDNVLPEQARQVMGLKVTSGDWGTSGTGGTLSLDRGQS